MQQFPVAKEGLPYIAGGLLMTALSSIIHPFVMVLPALVTAFFVFFFRNPRRTGPNLPDCLISPADGRVLSVSQTEHDPFLEVPAIRISIFLSLFNVHINRSPMDGQAARVIYRPGQFLPAFKSHASEINERNTVVIKGTDTTIAVHQITGFIARRIVCDVQEGDELKQRQRFGLIRFGSCTELIMPLNFSAQVREGDKVRGGITVLAKRDLSATPEIAISGDQQT